VPNEAASTVTATPAAPAVAAVPAPAPAPAPAAAPAPSAKPASFADAMNRHGGFDDPEPAAADAPAAEPEAEAEPANDAEPAPEPEPKKPAKGGKGKGKPPLVAPAPAAPVAPAAAAPPAVAEPGPAVQDEIANLKAMAAKLGFDFDGTSVLSRERVAFRDNKRRSEAALSERQQQIAAQLEQAKRDFAPDVEFAQAVKAAWKRGDPEQFAKALGAENFDKFQEYFIRMTADPHYQELQELKKKQDAIETERQREKEAMAAQSERNNRLMARRRYEAQLSEQMAQSKDPLVQAMHDDPNFIRAVMKIQEQNWDGEKTVPAERAVRMAAAEGGIPLGRELQMLYQRLAKVFGQTAAAEAVQAVVESTEAAAAAPAANTNKPGAKPRPRTGVVPTTATPQPSNAAKMTRKEFDVYMAKRLAEARAEDARNGD